MERLVRGGGSGPDYQWGTRARYSSTSRSQGWPDCLCMGSTVLETKSFNIYAFILLALLSPLPNKPNGFENQMRKWFNAVIKTKHSIALLTNLHSSTFIHHRPSPPPRHSPRNPPLCIISEKAFFHGIVAALQLSSPFVGRMAAIHIYSCYWPHSFAISVRRVFTCARWPASGSFQDNHVLLWRKKTARYFCCFLSSLFVSFFFFS